MGENQMYKNGTKCGLISKLYIVLLLTALIGNASVLAAEASDPAGPLPQYDYIEPFSEGLAAARENNRWGFVNEFGEVAIPFVYSEVSAFSEGLAVVRVEGRYGYMDQNGDIVIEPRFEQAGPFREGRAVVRVDGKYGAIDRGGNLAVAAEYDEMQPFNEGFAVVCKGGYYNYVNRNGDRLLATARLTDAYPFSSGLARVRDYYGSWYYINSSGYFAFRPAADWADTFIDGYSIVTTGYGSYLIDSKGVRVSGTFEIMERADEAGYFIIYSNGRYGYYDTFKRTAVMSYQYQRILPPSEGLSLAVKDGLYGFVDTNLRTVIPFNYSYAGKFEDGLSIVMKNGKYGYINTKGEEVIPCIYEEAEPFNEGLAVVRVDRNYGCIDKAGTFVIPDEFGYIQGFENGVSIAKLSGRYVVLRNPIRYESFAEAVPSGAKIKVDGEPADIEAYVIEGHNYIQIKDLAYVLRGSYKKFDFEYRADADMLILYNNKVYVPGGSEQIKSRYAKPRAALCEEITIGTAYGGKVRALSYIIAGGRYFKLRDIAALVDFSVEWNADDGEIVITTAKPYGNDTAR